MALFFSSEDSDAGGFQQERVWGAKLTLSCYCCMITKASASWSPSCFSKVLGGLESQAVWPWIPRGTPSACRHSKFSIRMLPAKLAFIPYPWASSVLHACCVRDFNRSSTVCCVSPAGIHCGFSALWPWQLQRVCRDLVQWKVPDDLKSMKKWWHSTDTQFYKWRDGVVSLFIATLSMWTCHSLMPQDAAELASILNWLGFAWSRDRMKAVLKEAIEKSEIWKSQKTLVFFHINKAKIILQDVARACKQNGGSVEEERGYVWELGSQNPIDGSSSSQFKEKHVDPPSFLDNLSHVVGYMMKYTVIYRYIHLYSSYSSHTPIVSPVISLVGCVISNWWGILATVTLSWPLCGRRWMLTRAAHWTCGSSFFACERWGRWNLRRWSSLDHRWWT